MTSHRERLTAPVSWWIGAAVFAAVWGWIVLVAISTTAAWVTAGGVLVLTWALVGAYGGLVVAADPRGLRAGRALLDPAHLGPATALDRVAYKDRLGAGADARALLVTRPYVERGVLVEVADPADPTPYWLVSSRRPERLAAAVEAARAAVGHTGSTTSDPTIGDTSGGHEEV